MQIKQLDAERKNNQRDHEKEDKSLKRNQLNSERMRKKRLIEKEDAIFNKHQNTEMKRNDDKRKKNELDHENKEKI